MLDNDRFIEVPHEGHREEAEEEVKARVHLVADRVSTLLDTREA